MRTPPSEYARYVEKAQLLLKLDGFNGSLEYLTATKLDAEGQHLVQVILWNNERIRCQVFLTESKCERVLSPWETEARKLGDFLPKLGWKAPFITTNEPDGWAQLNKQEVLVNFLDSNNKNIYIREDLADHRIINLSAEDANNGGSYNRYDPTSDETATARTYFQHLGISTGDDDHATRSGDTICFTRSIPPKTNPFEVQLRATLFLSSKSLRIISFNAPTKQQVHAASTIAPLDVDYLSTAEILHAEIGETKGRRFSRAVVNLGNAAWGDRLDLEVFGWVSADNSKITALDGVEYPVKKLLSTSDVLDTITQPSRQTSQNGLLCNTVTPVAPILLFDAGEAEVAERLYHQMATQNRSNLAYSLCNSLSISYRMLVADNLKHGQYKEALRWSNLLVKVEAERANQTVPPAYFGSGNSGKDLEEALSIQEDLERRVLASTERRGTTTTAALIKSLDNLTTAQNAQPGGVYFGNDPTVIKLVAQGTSAVNELIEAIRSDDRFTRAISFGRNFFPQRTFHKTREVEILALMEIWPSCPNEDWSKPQVAAQALSEAWKPLGQMNEANRNFGFLQSNNWQTRHVGEKYFTSKKLIEGQTNVPRKEISSVMIKNVQEESSSLPPTQNGIWMAMSALQSAHYLALWERGDSVQTLRAASARIIDFSDHYDRNQSELSEVTGLFGQVISDRIELGDAGAVSDYERMLKHVTVGGLSYQSKFWEPAWKSNPSSPFYTVAEQYFDNLEKGLSEQNAIDNQYFYMFGADSGLLKLPAFRHLLVAIVKRDDTFGEVGLSGKGIPYCKFSNGSSSVIIPKGSHFKLKPDETVKISLGDYYSTWFSSSIKKAPRVYLWASAKDREEAKNRFSKFLLNDNYNWSSIINTLPVQRRYEGQGTFEYRGK